MLNIQDLIQVVNEHLQKGNGQAALDLLQSLQTQYPAEPHLPLFQAQILASYGQVDKAIEVYTNIGQRFPSFSNAFAALGAIYDQRGQNDLAFQQWLRASENNPGLHSFAIHSLLKSPSADSLTLLEAAREWGNRHGTRSRQAQNYRFASYRGDRVINIGYSCAFWFADTIRFLVVPAARGHDRNRFRVYGYSPRPVEARVAGSCDVFRVCGQLNDDEFINQVARTGLTFWWR